MDEITTFLEIKNKAQNSISIYFDQLEILKREMGSILIRKNEAEQRQRETEEKMQQNRLRLEKVGTQIESTREDLEKLRNEIGALVGKKQKLSTETIDDMESQKFDCVHNLPESMKISDTPLDLVTSK